VVNKELRATSVDLGQKKENEVKKILAKVCLNLSVVNPDLK